MKILFTSLLVFLAVLGVASKIPGNRKIIVGGQPAPAGRYPYMSGMLSSINARPYCGGSLITPTVVYTAAHCPAPSFVSVGCLNVNDSCARQGGSIGGTRQKRGYFPHSWFSEKAYFWGYN